MFATELAYQNRISVLRSRVLRVVKASNTHNWIPESPCIASPALIRIEVPKLLLGVIIALWRRGWGLLLLLLKRRHG